MNIDHGNKYKNSEKKLKKHYDEKNKLDKIIAHIKMNKCFEELKKNPVSIIYEYEALKHELNGYHSFNLCKKGGVIRLVFSVNINTNTIVLEFVTMNHYDDFKNII